MQETIQPAESDRKEFHITDRQSAEWLLRKLGNLRAERARIVAQSEALLRQLDADRDSLLHLYGGELEAWAREELQRRGGRRKTLHTLQGSLRFRNVPARLSITDERAAIDRAQQEGLPDSLYTQWRLDRDAYLRHATAHWEETGEYLDGVESHPERETFLIASES